MEAVSFRVNENKEIMLEFQVPPKLTNILIDLSCEVENKSQEKKNHLLQNPPHNSGKQTIHVYVKVIYTA